MQTQPKDNSGITLLFILVLAALLRIWGLGAKQLWLDELLQVLHSRPDSLSGILASVIRDRGGAPLDYFVQHVFISNLNGAIEWTARLHAAIFGVLAVWLVYLVCRELFANQRLALMSALLFCFYPFHVHYSQEGRPYSLFILLTLILYFILFRLLKKSSPLLWILFIVTAILDFHTNPFTAAALFGQFVFLIYYQKCRRERWTAAWRRYASFVICSIVAAAAYLPWLAYSFFIAQGEESPKLGLRLVSETIKGLGDGSYILSIVLIVFAIAGIHYLAQTQRRLELGALLTWLLAPLPVIFAVLMWRTYFYHPRQILFITPAFLMLVAAGVEYFKQKFPRRYCYPEMIIIFISFAVMALHYFDLFHPDERDDVRAAGIFLKENVRHGDLVVSPRLSEVLTFYFPDSVKYSAEQLSAQDLMKSVPGGSRIIYAAPRFNPDLERLNFLLARMRKSDEKRLQGITIYFFQNPENNPAPLFRK